MFLRDAMETNEMDKNLNNKGENAPLDLGNLFPIFLIGRIGETMMSS